MGEFEDSYLMKCADYLDKYTSSKTRDRIVRVIFKFVLLVRWCFSLRVHKLEKGKYYLLIFLDRGNNNPEAGVGVLVIEKTDYAIKIKDYGGTTRVIPFEESYYWLIRKLTEEETRELKIYAKLEGVSL